MSCFKSLFGLPLRFLYFDFGRKLVYAAYKPYTFTDYQEERAAMLTYEDCLGLCDLTEEEVDAIAEHEHIPDIVAAELGNYLVHEEPGVRKIRRIILDDIETAEQKGDKEHALVLKLTLRHFVETHPSAKGSPA